MSLKSWWVRKTLIGVVLRDIYSRAAVAGTSAVALVCGVALGVWVLLATGQVETLAGLTRLSESDSLRAVGVFTVGGTLPAVVATYVVFGKFAPSWVAREYPGIRHPAPYVVATVLVPVALPVVYYVATVLNDLAAPLGLLFVGWNVLRLLVTPKRWSSVAGSARQRLLAQGLTAVAVVAGLGWAIYSPAVGTSVSAWTTAAVYLFAAVMVASIPCSLARPTLEDEIEGNVDTYVHDNYLTPTADGKLRYNWGNDLGVEVVDESSPEERYRDLLFGANDEWGWDALARDHRDARRTMADAIEGTVQGRAVAGNPDASSTRAAGLIENLHPGHYEDLDAAKQAVETAQTVARRFAERSLSDDWAIYEDVVDEALAAPGPTGELLDRLAGRMRPETAPVYESEP